MDTNHITTVSYLCTFCTYKGRTPKALKAHLPRKHEEIMKKLKNNSEEVKDQREVVGNEIVEDVVEARTEADCDILDATWSEKDKFVKVIGQDGSTEEAEIRRIFESGKLTKTMLVESLPKIGWESLAEFLPGWFKRLDTNTFMKTQGTTTFFFITDKFDICLSATSALSYLLDKDYSNEEINQFEQYIFKI